MRLHPLVERALIVIFIGAVFVPLAGTMAGIDRQHASSEQRTLAPWPHFEWSVDSVRALPDSATRYFEDHFAFRNRLVQWQATLRLTAFGVSPSDAVITGRDGWLFYAEDGAMDDYAEAPPFTAAELEHWRRTLEDTRNWLRERGIAYLFVISPDKHVIYPEFMPAGIRRAAVSRIEQLVTYMRAHSDVPVLDLTPALIAAKSSDRIYHLTDTHWNDRGAFVGYREIMNAIADAAPDVDDRSPRAYEGRAVRSAGLDLAGMMGLTRVLSEEDLVLIPRTPPVMQVIEPATPNPRFMHDRIVTEAPIRADTRAVVFMDSFGAGLVPFLSEHFRRSVYLWQHNVDLGVIERERPAIVIHEWVGRRLSTQVPYNAVAAQEGSLQQTVASRSRSH